MDTDSPSENSDGVDHVDAAAERTRRRWLNITLAVGLLIASVGFVVETRRALAGHLPAWVYVIEWPLLGFVGFLMWHRLIREDPTTSAPNEQDDVIGESWKDFSARSRSDLKDS